MQGETTLVGANIEGLAVGIAGRGSVVQTLVKKGSGLLPGVGVVVKRGRESRVEHRRRIAMADLLLESSARDFVADAFAHCKFIGYVDAAVPLFEKAGRDAKADRHGAKARAQDQLAEQAEHGPLFRPALQVADAGADEVSSTLTLAGCHAARPEGR